MQQILNNVNAKKRLFFQLDTTCKEFKRYKKFALCLTSLEQATDFLILKVTVYMAEQYFEWYSKSSFQIHKVIQLMP